MDVSMLEAKIAEIKVQLDNVGAVKRGLSGAAKHIEEAKTDLKAMEVSIRETLSEMLELIQPRRDQHEE